MGTKIKRLFMVLTVLASALVIPAMTASPAEAADPCPVGHSLGHYESRATNDQETHIQALSCPPPPSPAACNAYTFVPQISFTFNNTTYAGYAYAGFSNELLVEPSGTSSTARGFEAQCLLARFGRWSPGSIDGIFGPNSRAAARAFQTDTNNRYGAGLSVDGLVGPQTWKWLRWRAAFSSR